MIDSLVNNILYGLCGFMFALFALRFCIRATDKIKRIFSEQGFSMHFFLACLPSFICILVSLFLFPILLYTRTPVGGFVYLATYIFFNMKIRASKK